MAHGADPFLKNQEGQTPLDLAGAEDVRSLLQDAMAANPTPCPTPVLVPPPSPSLSLFETVVMPSGTSVTLSAPVPAQTALDNVSEASKENAPHDITTLGGFLGRLENWFPFIHTL